MVFSPAFAQEVSGAAMQEPGFLASIMPLLLIFAIMYLLIIRPQQKKYKAHQTMVQSVKKGDKVLTGGGIIGKVVKVDEKEEIVHVEIADTVTIQVARSTLANVYNKETEAKTVAEKPVTGKKQKSANDN